MYEGPGYYRHYKGHHYKVHGRGVLEADLAPVVSYEPIYEAGINQMKMMEASFWVRPYDNFNGEVNSRNYRGPRFELVPEDEVTAT